MSDDWASSTVPILGHNPNCGTTHRPIKYLFSGDWGNSPVQEYSTGHCFCILESAIGISVLHISLSMGIEGLETIDRSVSLTMLKHSRKLEMTDETV